jgi:hypothetical protein
VLAPPQPLGDQDLVDPAAADAEALLVLEVGAEPVERPRAERQAQGPRVGQGGGEHLGDLLGGVDGGAAGAGHIL